MRYALELAYDGTPFIGWQNQSEGKGTSIQGRLEECVSRILREEISLVGCGRTDTGVHARYFVAHFDTGQEINKEEFLFRLNRTLPAEIAVYDLKPVNDRFHARFSPLSRKYEYHLHTSKDPFLIRTSYYRFGKIDLDKINEACKYLLQLQNFRSFSKAKTNVKTFNCRLDECYWEEKSKGEGYVFHVKADRFLRNMVRAMVGTLIDVGTDKMSLDQLKEAMEKQDRSATGKSVPANGLFLTEVNYNWSEFVLNG